MTQLVWVSVVGAIALTIWTYGHRPLRMNELGSVSARWLEEYRNDTHRDR